MLTLTSNLLRAALPSSCKAKGPNIAEIMKSAGWSNSSTFARFQDKPVDTAAANFGSVLFNSDTLCSVFCSSRLGVKMFTL